MGSPISPALLAIFVITALEMEFCFTVRHGRNLIWAQTDEERSGISRIVSIDGDPDRWVPNRTATTRYITAPSDKWHFMGLAYDYRKQKIYWSDTGNKKIQGFLLNGTDMPFTIFDGISSGVGSLALDWLTGNIYWADSLYNWIVMAPAVPDTRLFRVVVGTELDQPMGLVVHPLRGLLFWSDWGAVAKIERSDTRGQGRRILVTRDLMAPMGLVLDMAEERLYWVDRDGGTIESIDIFGDDRKTHFTVEDTQFVSIALYHDYLFVTDQQDRLLYAFNRKSGKHEVNFSMGTSTPASVIMYDSEPQKQSDRGGNCGVMMCDHMCVSTYGGQAQCVCASGYELQPDGIACVDDGKYPTPMFVYSIGNALCRFPGNLPDMTLDGVTLDTQCFLTNRKSVLALGANVRENMLYFAENETKTISKVKLAQGESPEIIIGGTGVVEGLAVDWLASNLYWSDSAMRKIMVAKTNGRFQRVLHDVRLDKPRGVAVDAKNRFLYWTDVGLRPRIERSLLDGSGRHVFVNNAGVPNHVMIDYRSNRVYWTDSGRGHITSVDFSGQARRIVIQETRATYFGITLFQDFLIWTETGRKNGIHTGLKDSGDKIRGIVHPDVGHASDVITFDVSVQPLASGPCDSLHNCQQLCLPGNDSRTKSCACAMGLDISADRSSCLTEPWLDNFLLFADTFQKQIYQVHMRTGEFKAISLTAHDNPIGVTFDPVDRKLYWSDVTAKVLKRALLNGSKEEVVKLLPSDSIPDGIAMDSVSRLLYYTDAGNQIIAAITVEKKYHVTLINDKLDKPRAITIDSIRGYMYWSDWSVNSRIEKAAMDGSRRSIIVDTGRNNWPNGLTVDTKAEKIYWCDARTEAIEAADLDGGNKHKLFQDEHAHLFGITAVDGILFYTDWSKKTIMKLEKVGNVYSSTSIGQAVFARANDIHAFKFESDKRGVILNACSARNGGCSHVCIPIPEGRKCACPDGSNINRDLLTCISPHEQFNGGLLEGQPPQVSVTDPPPVSPPAPWREPMVTTKEREEFILYQPSSSKTSSISTLATSTSTQLPKMTTKNTYPVSDGAHGSRQNSISSNKSENSDMHLETTTVPVDSSKAVSISPDAVRSVTEQAQNNMHVTAPRDTEQSSQPMGDVTMDSLQTSPAPNYDPDYDRPKFPLFDPDATEAAATETEGTSRADGVQNITRRSNASDISIIDSELTYIKLGGILLGGTTLMLIVTITAVILYKKSAPRKSRRDRSDSARAAPTHVPNFHATYEMPLQDTMTSSGSSAERLAHIGNNFYANTEDRQGLENPSFVRRDSGNTIYEEIQGFGGKDPGSPTFTTFTQAAEKLESQFDYLTDNYVLTNGRLDDNIRASQSSASPYAKVQRSDNNMHTVTAHVHTQAHHDAVDHGNYHVIHAKNSPSEESSFSRHDRFPHMTDAENPPAVPEKRKLLVTDDVYATISRARRQSANAKIAAAIEQHHMKRPIEHH